MDAHLLPVARPPWTRVGNRLESACRKALYDFSLLDGAQKLAVALSGGKDSLALLFLLHAINGKGFPPFDLMAIHVQGDFSCGASLDAGFLDGICRELNVPLILRTSKKQQNPECYSCSRERRKLLFEAALAAGAKTIAFGHHSDDLAQTVLLNLLHKAEFAGMLPKVPMRRYGVTIIRPLIYVREEDIRKFAKESGFLRISCQCPIGQNSKRRQTDRLLSQIQEIFPHARSNVAKSRTHLRVG